MREREREGWSIEGRAETAGEKERERGVEYRGKGRDSG